MKRRPRTRDAVVLVSVGDELTKQKAEEGMVVAVARPDPRRPEGESPGAVRRRALHPRDASLNELVCYCLL